MMMRRRNEKEVGSWWGGATRGTGEVGQQFSREVGDGFCATLARLGTNDGGRNFLILKFLRGMFEGSCLTASSFPV